MHRIFLLLAAALVTAAAPPGIRDLDSRSRQPFAPSGAASVLFFVTTDCPISNGYAPEIQRLCAAYGRRGVECLLLYEDARLSPDAARTHRAAYGLAGVAAAIDGDRAIATAAGATITPEAVVIDRRGALEYRGRIDDLYVALGRRRPAPTSHDLQEAIDAVLAGRSAAPSRTTALGCYIAPPWHEAKEPS